MLLEISCAQEASLKEATHTHTHHHHHHHHYYLVDNVITNSHRNISLRRVFELRPGLGGVKGWHNHGTSLSWLGICVYKSIHRTHM